MTVEPPRARHLMACATAVLAVSLLSGCDSAPAVGANARQVTVVGSGEVRAAPDTLTAEVGIEVVAPDATTAMNQASERQQAVLDQLAARGIEAADIATSGVDLQPQYGDNSVITGYRAENSIMVTLRELDAAPDTLALIVTAGGDATRINSVSYSIEEDSALVSEARALAFDDARTRAEQYADLSGLSLGTVISISEAPGSPQPRSPMPVPQGARAAAAPVPVPPGEQTVGFSVTVVWELG